jgi:S-adenosylmethionine-diacylglycerol 3-amino-3-carboxypropyl transferase
MAMRRRLADASFRFVHGHALVYNTCWEDPRLDREALALGPDDTMVVITSAGCNVLDYALDAPRSIHAVDLNPRQNALLELKVAAIRTLEFDEFFQLFGRGRLRGWPETYRRRVRPLLSDAARECWDRREHWFDPKAQAAFYFRGTTGLAARMANTYLNLVIRARPSIEALINAADVDAQRDIYDRALRDRLWTPLFQWWLRRDSTLALLAVPRPQREHIERDYPSGIVGFIRERIEAVFTRLPMADNYFWRVYLTGEYSPSCCPEYLKRSNFERLKDGLVDRISIQTTSVQAFLESHETSISRFVLLDHMDWLCDDGNAALGREWRAILQRAAPGARVLWRSGGRATAFVDRLVVDHDGRPTRVGDRLTYDRPLAERLHARDRVHTYGSFHIADLAA